MGLGNSTTGQMTEGELNLVQSSWQVVMENPEQNGVFIFKTFLEKHNYYGYFKKFSGVPIEDLPENIVFRKHAALILHALNNVALYMDNDSLLRNELNMLGKMHKSKNITEKQFEELKAVILETLEKQFELPEESVNAWHKALSIAFVYIFEVLK